MIWNSEKIHKKFTWNSYEHIQISFHMHFIRNEPPGTSYICGVSVVSQRENHSNDLTSYLLVIKTDKHYDGFIHVSFKNNCSAWICHWLQWHWLLLSCSFEYYGVEYVWFISEKTRHKNVWVYATKIRHHLVMRNMGRQRCRIFS